MEENVVMIRVIRKIKVVSVVVCITLFLLQTKSNVDLWLREPLSSSFNIDDNEPAEMPSITVCPNPPFNFDALIELGLNISSSHVEELGKRLDELEDMDLFAEELVRRLDELEGVEASIEELWGRAAWSLGDVIHDVQIGGYHFAYIPGQTSALGWRPSLTPLGPCLTFTHAGPASMVNMNIRYQMKQCQFAISEFGFLRPCHVIEAQCNTSCTWEAFVQKVNGKKGFLNTNIILHSADDPPTLARPKAIISSLNTYNEKKDLEVWVNAKRVKRISRNSLACNSDPEYSEDLCHQRCVEPCHPRSLAKRPRHPTWKQNNRHTVCVSDGSHMYHVFQNFTDAHHNCMDKCKPKCSRMIFKYFTKYYQPVSTSPFFHVKLRQHAHYQATVTETLAYSTSRLLADIGGSLGLFLGLSLSFFWTETFSLLHKFSGGTKNIIWSENNSSQRDVKSRFKQVQNSQLKNSPSLKVETWNTHRLWRWGGLVMLLALMSAHILTAVTSYVWQPLTTLLSVGTHFQPFPEVVVCPYFPFNRKILRNEFETPFFCAQEEKLMAKFLDNLPGHWHVEGDDIQKMWQESARNASDYFVSTTSSRPILTTNNICHVLNSSEEVRSIVIDMQEVCLRCKCMVNKVWILFPERGVEPVMIQSNKVYLHEFSDMHIDTELKFSNLEMLRIAPCQPLPYRRTNCLEECHLKAAASAIGCSLPYLNMTNISACTTHAQYVASVKYVVDMDSSVFKALDIGNECKKQCPKECHTQYYQVTSIQDKDKQYVKGLNIIFSRNQYLKIEESFSESFSNLLNELGGIVGLYVGWSLMDVGEMLNKGLVIVGVSAGIMGKMSERTTGMAKYSFRLLCLIMAAVLWSERIFEYVWKHPFYTHYGIEPIRSKHFPSLTVCRWPPFNLSRLVELGLQYDSKEHCEYNGRFYRCFRGSEVIRSLPGVWSKPLAKVWEDSAWELVELVDSFQIDGKYFYITDKEAESRWRPVLTLHNRCFTFTPAEEGGLTSYSVTLNTDYRGERRLRRNCTHDLIHNSLRIQNEAFSLVRLHDRNELLYTLDKDDFYEEIDYGSSYAKKFSLSLLQMKTISREGHECETSSRYSRGECLSRCKSSLIGKKRGCRLPYDTWSDLPLCNQSKYRIFPRPLGMTLTTLINLNGESEAKQIEVECQAFCLKSCSQSIYTTLSTENKPFTKSVIVEFTDPSYDIIVEEDGYTWAQLVSDLGGVGGFMLGISLLSISHTLLDLVWMALGVLKQSE